MSFVIKHGLFRFNITDYHAILGTSLDADAKQIRLRYLKIAQKLHPDTCKSDSSTKKLASQILSKLVNPAYEQLSRKNTFAEHQLILTQIGKRLAENKQQLSVVSEPAKELMKSSNKLELVYPKLLKKFTAEQYQNLEHITKKIAIISELHLVYLTLKQEQGIQREEQPRRISSQAVKSPPKAPVPQSQKPTPSPPSKAPSKTNSTQDNQEPKPSLRIDAYIRRGNEYIAKNSFTQAISELRDGLKIDPNHSTCHALIGKVYLLQQQLTMAKVHINRAYQANPQDPIVIEIKQKLDKLTKKIGSSSSKGKKSKSSTAQSKSKAKSPSSGIFGGLFGAKKK